MDVSRYKGIFLAEAGEHLRALDQGLVELESNPDNRGILDQVFRSAHSIKGMAASMGYDQLQSLAHRLEDVLEPMREDGELRGGVADVLLSAVDQMREIVDCIEADQQYPGDVAGTLARIEALESGSEVAPKPASKEKTAGALGLRRGDPPSTPAGAGATGAGRRKSQRGPAAGAPRPASAAAMRPPAAPAAAPPRDAPAEPSPVSSLPTETSSEPERGGASPGVAATAAPVVASANWKRRWRIAAEVSQACSSPSVRAFIVYRKMAALGEVLRLEPPIEMIRSGEFAGKLSLELRTVLDPREIRRVLESIPDLSSFGLEEAEVAPPDPPPHRSAETALPAAPRSLPVPPRAPDPLRTRGATKTVRVRTELLDRFMDSLADLLMAKAHLQEASRRLGDRDLAEAVGILERSAREIHDRVMEVRLLPFGMLTERLPRLVRDVAVRAGKRVRLEVEGAEVEVDRAVIEGLDTPLTHLLRNAVDHGIESAEVRAAAGKSPEGLVRVTARRERGEVAVEVSDDGRGVDTERLRQQALERGLIAPELAQALDDWGALQLIFLPGLSTAREVSEVSGRGVGMDAVKASVDALGGNLEISSEAGVGTRFVMRLPVTVAVLNVLVVQTDGQIYAFPVSKVERALLATGESLQYVEGHLYYAYGEEHPVPILSLAPLLGLGPPRPLQPPLPLVLVATEQGPVALAVDGFQGQREVVLRPLGKLLERIEGLSAIVLFGDGRPAFLLDANKLCRGWI